MDGLTRRRGNGLVRLLHVDGAPVVVAVSGTVFAARAATEAAAPRGHRPHAVRHRHRRRPRGLPRALPRRPAARPRDPRPPVAARAPQPDAVRGAHLGDHRAADRARPRQGDPAPPDRRPRPALRRACATRRTPRRSRPWRPRRSTPAAWPRSAPGRSASPRARWRRGDSSGATNRRLLAIPEIGTWTVECLALYGLGRLDVVPAGDLGYLKLVGRLSTGNPRAIADEDEVRGFFSAYAPYAGMAALYLSGPAKTLPAPRPAGTRWSAGSPRRAAA